MSHGDPTKWHLPGWRIEQKFSPGVLIGNWAEERYSFQKGDNKHNSTHRTDFRNYGSCRPDVIVRRKAQLQNDGLGKEFLFHHHGNRYSNNMISWYDEHFNKRPREQWDQLPELRHWDSHQLAWVPEKSDHPMQGAPTNFGKGAGMSHKWKDQLAAETQGDYNTTYRSSYIPTSAEAFVRHRYATDKEQSTTLHAFNKVNKDLTLRNTTLLRSPESLSANKPLSAAKA